MIIAFKVAMTLMIAMVVMMAMMMLVQFGSRTSIYTTLPWTHFLQIMGPLLVILPILPCLSAYFFLVM